MPRRFFGSLEVSGTSAMREYSSFQGSGVASRGLVSATRPLYDVWAGGSEVFLRTFRLDGEALLRVVGQRQVNRRLPAPRHRIGRLGLRFPLEGNEVHAAATDGGATGKDRHQNARVCRPHPPTPFVADEDMSGAAGRL